jgi:hypothetical protein
MQQLEKAVDWYDAVCQRLEVLRLECLKDARSGQCGTVPPNGLFQHVKQQMQDLRRLAGFPANLPVADVWLGPEGEIGLTWEFDDDKSVDLIYGAKCFVIRFTDDLKQHKVEPKNLPRLLATLAA